MLQQALKKMRARRKQAMDRQAAFLRYSEALMSKTADPLVRTRGRPRQTDPDTNWAAWFGANVRPVYTTLAALIPMLVKTAGPSGLLIGKIGKTFGNPEGILRSMGFTPREIVSISKRRLNISRELVDDIQLYSRPNVYWQNPVTGDDAEESLARLQTFMTQAEVLQSVVEKKMQNSVAKSILTILNRIIRTISRLAAVVAKHGGLDQVASRLASFGTLRGRPSALS